MAFTSQYPKGTKDKALALLASGKRMLDVSKNLGIPYKTLYAWETKAERHVRGVPYPEDVKRKAVAMVRGGKSQGQVAKELGIAQPTVGQWCRAVGIHIGRRTTGKHSTPEMRKAAMVMTGEAPVQHPKHAEVIALLKQGRTPTEISAKTGVHRTTIADWGVQVGVYARKQPRGGRQKRGVDVRVDSRIYSDQMKERAFKLLGEGRSLTDVAREVGAVTRTVAAWVKAAGKGDLGRERRAYDREFQIAAVARAAEVGLTAASHELGISSSMLTRWRAKYKRAMRQAKKAGLVVQTRDRVIPELPADWGYEGGLPQPRVLMSPKDMARLAMQQEEKPPVKVSLKMLAMAMAALPPRSIDLAVKLIVEDADALQRVEMGNLRVEIDDPGLIVSITRVLLEWLGDRALPPPPLGVVDSKVHDAASGLEVEVGG